MGDMPPMGDKQPGGIPEGMAMPAGVTVSAMAGADCPLAGEYALVSGGKLIVK